MQVRTLFLILLLSVVATGCMSVKPLPTPAELMAPEPIEGSEGEYLSPYTYYGTVAPWVKKGKSAKAGAAIGGVAGREIGERALESVPLVGGLLGKRAGKAIGRKVALEMVGGEEYMRETSDLSFDDVDDLIVYLYVTHSSDEDYAEVMKLTMSIYPEVEARWAKALREAVEG